MKINIEFRGSSEDPVQRVKTRLMNITGLRIKSIEQKKSGNSHFFERTEVVVTARFEKHFEKQLGKVCKDIREAISVDGMLTLQSIFDGYNDVTKLNPLPPLSEKELALYSDPRTRLVNTSSSSRGLELEFKPKLADEMKSADWQKTMEPVVLAIIQKIKQSARGIHSCVQPNHFIYRIERDAKIFRIKAVGVGLPEDTNQAVREIFNNFNCALALVTEANKLQLTGVASDSFYFENEPSWQQGVIYKAVIGCLAHEQKILSPLSKDELETKLGKAFCAKYQGEIKWEVDEAHQSVILGTGCFPESYIASFFGKKLEGCNVEYLPAENKAGHVSLKVNQVDVQSFKQAPKLGNM